jgi:hypothetical protein
MSSTKINSNGRKITGCIIFAYSINVGVKFGSKECIDLEVNIKQIRKVLKSEFVKFGHVEKAT